MRDLVSRLGIPVWTLIGKAGYITAILIGWAITGTLAHWFLQPWGSSHAAAEQFAIVSTIAQLFIATFFLVWLRHVYRSEGGKSAALALAMFGLALAIAGLGIAYFST